MEFIKENLLNPKLKDKNSTRKGYVVQRKYHFGGVEAPSYPAYHQAFFGRFAMQYVKPHDANKTYAPKEWRQKVALGLEPHFSDPLFDALRDREWERIERGEEGKKFFELKDISKMENGMFEFTLKHHIFTYTTGDWKHPTGTRKIDEGIVGRMVKLLNVNLKKGIAGLRQKTFFTNADGLQNYIRKPHGYLSVCTGATKDRWSDFRFGDLNKYFTVSLCCSNQPNVLFISHHCSLNQLPNHYRKLVK